MSRISIGEFEELVLLTIGILHQEAYGIAIMDELELRSKRTVMISSVHKTVSRLEKKGLVSSSFGGKTKERGGRAKKLFNLTNAGKICLQESRNLRNEMWTAIPETIWK